jgi:pullulanase-type alpha-1,6-glucosidase
MVAWDLGPLPHGARLALHHAPTGGLQAGPHGMEGGFEVPLTPDPHGLPGELRERFPHLAHFTALRLPADRIGDAREVVRGQTAVSARDEGGGLRAATGLQLGGVLDDLFRWDGPLGALVHPSGVTVRVWAPTARSVRLLLYDGSTGDGVTPVEMTPDRGTGTWTAEGDRAWRGRFYLYEVAVYVPATGRVEVNLVTDPYSLSLSTNSRRSQVVDLDDPALKPAGWDRLVKPALDAVEDAVVYELHVRDFSASDPTVPPELRGTFRAFALPASQGLDHLQSLAEAGLTHVHLLPAFDFATVDDDRSRWHSPAGDLAACPPDSDRQQAAVRDVAGQDGFNWGYDPLHYTVPEGSYATDPDGPQRILEFREMVAALAARGLRVVMDVVYNHTNAAGQSDRSVLDRIVPGYYHRLNGDGFVETTSCCPNTASERAMTDKLIVDSVDTWARAYKVDGFRFDLMGHHMKRTMLRVRDGVRGLLPERDGVDGRVVLLYGEGWDFGEVAGGRMGENATQRAMAGTGIATFNDRLRDAARGGGAFSGPQEQGFLTGLLDTPNASEQGTVEERRERLRLFGDRIRVGLAGGLAGYTFRDRTGRTVRGAEIDYHGQPTGITSDPGETVNYVEAHDNETLFDAIALKLPPSLAMAERVRIQNLGMSLLAFGQGLPFFHAGVELLRSKSLDRNSYDSGDWFNRVDWSGTHHNFGSGLPPAPDNRRHWALLAPFLANAALRPRPAHIRRATDHFREVLQVRRSSPLFRLRSGAEVQARLQFHDGEASTPGVIAFSLWDREGERDPRHPVGAVVLNATARAVAVDVPALAGVPLALHPAQAASDDRFVRSASFEARGRFHVPHRTAAVFWAERLG